MTISNRDDIKRKWFCQTRLGFGLIVAPLVMKCINATVRSQESVGRATSPYIDDVYVNVSIMSAEHAKINRPSMG